MDCDEEEKHDLVRAPAEDITGSAVNSCILDYYKKFGRKRDLEQYFSLSTAQSDLKDPSSTFWQRMKSEDNSDSSEKKSDSSQELCRISIRCSVTDPCSSQYHTKPNKPILTGSALLESLGIHVKPMEDDSKTKSESVSPPIIIEDVTHDATQNSDDDSIKSCDNNSQKSFDVLDTSANKPLSPSSSITSQRKLEWDSLADVGYANESDRKASASSLSTLERLALKQQYSNSDTKLDNILEPPTAHSTPYDENEIKAKKKGTGKKSMKIYKKDVDYLEVNVPHSSENIPQHSFNVNLTKHISFNVEKDGKVTFENVQKDVSITPEKNNIVAAVPPKVSKDKEMQTSLTKSRDLSEPQYNNIQNQKIPVLISLNTLRRNNRRKKLRIARKKIKAKKIAKDKVPVQEKSGEPLSEAESFEYMPGHMYNQNQLNSNDHSGNTAGNKSSLESSGVVTSDSSKGTKHSFSKDLEKGIGILNAALQRGGNDKNLRKQLIKQLCERLVRSKYRDDESSTEFLSGLCLTNNAVGERNHITTSTSDNSADKSKIPKKSILRNDKFNSEPIASTSQSAPNLPVAANSERLVSSKLMKNLTSSNTDSDISQKGKSSSDSVFAKTSSQELYQKYLDALKREEAYKRHLKDKEKFLKQKLVCSDSAIKAPTRPDSNVNFRLKDLINDLTRNNYDDGSGDASKLEGGPYSSRNYNERFVPIQSQRTHSVFTLSSSDQNVKKNLKKRLQTDIRDLAKPGTSKEHYCCCPHHSQKSTLAPGVADSSIQVNIEHPCDDLTCTNKNKSPRPEKDHSPRSLAKVVADDLTGDIKYVCVCHNKTIQNVPDNFLIFKCSRLGKSSQEETSSKSSASNHSRNVSPCKTIEASNISNQVVQRCDKNARNSCHDKNFAMKSTTKSSQTNFLLKMLGRRSSDRSTCSSGNKKGSPSDCSDINRNISPVLSKIYEATRCLQTEISINPRIHEPCLADINIITNCAEVISEHCRDINMLTTTDGCSRQAIGTNVETGTYSGSSRKISNPLLTDVFTRPASRTYVKSDPTNSGLSKSSGTSKGICEMFDDDDIAAGCGSKISLELKEKTESQGSNSDRSEKFTIPIQGTNMTLMVSIGSNDRKGKTDDMVAQCVGTERNTVTEQATCLTDECSKGVQYDMDRISNNGKHTDYNSNVTNQEYCSTCSCGCAGDIDKCNKNCEERRISYDESKKCLSPQTKRKKSDSREIYIKDFRSSANQSPKYHEDNSKCSCGCAGDIDKCNKNCEVRIITYEESKNSLPSQKELKKSSSREIGIQNDLIRSVSQSPRKNQGNTKCSCGCAGDIDKCNKNCENRKKSFSKEISIQKNPTSSACQSPRINLGNTKCSCGCAGDIDKCNKNCEVHKTTYEESKNSLPSQKEPKKSSSQKIGIQKDLMSSASQSPRKNQGNAKCSCGCAGDIDKCNKNCQKREKGFSREIGTQNSPTSSASQSPRKNRLNSKCSCGCAGDIDKCNKNCEKRKLSYDEYNKSLTSQNERKQSFSREIGLQKDSSSSASQSPRKHQANTKCSCGCAGDIDKCNKNCQERITTYEESENSLPLQNEPKKSASREIGIQKDLTSSASQSPRHGSRTKSKFPEKNMQHKDNSCTSSKRICDGKKSDVCLISDTETDKESDPILEMIQSITKKYSKKDIEKNKRKKCFKEIMTVLNYLLETEDSTDRNNDCITLEGSTTTNKCGNKSEKKCPSAAKKTERPMEKCKKKSCVIESSDCPQSTDIPTTSSDSVACKVLNKIKKECERYHQKRCKAHCGKKCDISSSTSANCDQCRRVHHCSCRNHKCKTHKKCMEKIQKKAVAYNLILQTSESISEETVCNDQMRQLQNIVVKIPPQRKYCNVPFKEVSAKIESKMPPCSPRDPKPGRSRSLPNESEISSMEDFLWRSQACCTVREYLEKNRPDFIAKSSQRQNCLRIVSDSRKEDSCCENPHLQMLVVHSPQCTGDCGLNKYKRDAAVTCLGTQCYDQCVCNLQTEVKRFANMRASQRDTLSVRLAQLSLLDVNELDKDQIRQLAKELGRHMRQKRPASKFISEREMKKHSENIYKSLPEVVQKKEAARKENIKKTNLMMAYLFKKNLQKKTLRGAVDISNYSPIIQI